MNKLNPFAKVEKRAAKRDQEKRIKAKAKVLAEKKAKVSCMVRIT